VFAALALGLAVKAPMWPLHSWLPDAHTAAPTVGSVLLAGVLLKMGTYGLVRIACRSCPTVRTPSRRASGPFAVVGIVYGALACLAQRDLKRLIAFSSVGPHGLRAARHRDAHLGRHHGALFANVAHGLITGCCSSSLAPSRTATTPASLEELGGGLYDGCRGLGGPARVRRGRQPRACRASPGSGARCSLLGAFDPAPGLDAATTSCSWRSPAWASC
jgi:NADH-quinone oxidoreductase subunit M